MLLLSRIIIVNDVGKNNSCTIYYCTKQVVEFLRLEYLSGYFWKLKVLSLNLRKRSKKNLE